MTGRLVLINKVYPKIPTVEELRPITICSPIRKFLEANLVQKLKTHLRKNIEKSQIGFITKLGTDVNLKRYADNYEEIKGNNIIDKSGVLFIDLKSAFDTVPHDRLLEKVK